LEPTYSLDYFWRILDPADPAWAELRTAMADELEAYAHDVVAAGLRTEVLARLRHDHRPLVRNLALGRVEALEADLRDRAAAGEAQAAARLAGALGDLCLSVAADLRADPRS